MTDFQVGDRVSVEGVVGEISPEHSANKDAGYVLVKIGGQGRGGVFIDPEYVTLIERPLRKLRVGSVWECNGARFGSRYVWAGKKFIVLNDLDVYDRDDLTLDSEPDIWREVPVEELEGEA